MSFQFILLCWGELLAPAETLDGRGVEQATDGTEGAPSFAGRTVAREIHLTFCTCNLPTQCTKERGIIAPHRSHSAHEMIFGEEGNGLRAERKSSSGSGFLSVVALPWEMEVI